MPLSLAGLFCLILFYVSLPAGAAAAGEFLIFDRTFTFDETLNGFNWFQPPETAPKDWTSPDDYENGQVYTRFEILSQPTNAARPRFNFKHHFVRARMPTEDWFHSVTLADFDRDGDPDFILGDRWAENKDALPRATQGAAVLPSPAAASYAPICQGILGIAPHGRLTAQTPQNPRDSPTPPTARPTPPPCTARRNAAS
jgi:hypothetical protein